MNKSEIIGNLQKIYWNVSSDLVERLVNVFIQQLSEAMASGKRVELRGFGVFSVRQRSARLGRNPRNGHQICIAQKTVPFFKVGKPLQRKMNQPKEPVDLSLHHHG